MLTIRDEQLRLLETSVDDRMCAEAVRHIREAIPEVYGELGEEQVRGSVALARAKSVEYGFDSWAAVVGYLDVMYILGFEFDEDPRYPWASEILQEFDRPNEERLAQLLQMAMQTAAAADDSVA
jgi:hypothetical protein